MVSDDTVDFPTHYGIPILLLIAVLVVAHFSMLITIITFNHVVTVVFTFLIIVVVAHLAHLAHLLTIVVNNRATVTVT